MIHMKKINWESRHIETKIFDEKKYLRCEISLQTNISYTFSILEEKNWNKEWEKNFNPVFINDSCVIRAPFL